MSQDQVIFVDIRTPDDFLKMVGMIYHDQWIYRGHGDESWRLSTTLDRLNDSRREVLERRISSSKSSISKYFANMQLNDDTILLKNEYAAIQLFKAYAHCKNISNIEALCRMQHFGAATRLLDFTFSVFVALYFAFENRNIHTNRCIWALSYDKIKWNVNSIWEKYIEDRGIQQQDLSNATDEDKGRLTSDYYDDMLTNDLKFNKSCIEIADSYLEETDIPSFMCDIIPIEMPGDNERIDAQNGLFLFPTSIKSFEMNLCKSFGLNESQLANGDIHTSVEEYCKNRYLWNNTIILKLIFMNSDDFPIDSLLQTANVSAKSIYPGLEGIAKSVWKWKKF